MRNHFPNEEVRVQSLSILVVGKAFGKSETPKSKQTKKQVYLKEKIAVPITLKLSSHGVPVVFQVR